MTLEDFLARRLNPVLVTGSVHPPVAHDVRPGTRRFVGSVDGKVMSYGIGRQRTELFDFLLVVNFDRCDAAHVADLMKVVTDGVSCRQRTWALAGDVTMRDFLEKQGFRIDTSSFRSVINVGTFDLASFAEYEARVARQGIVIKSLVEFQDIEERIPILHSVGQAAEQGMPHALPSMTLDEVRELTADPRFSWNCQFVAYDGDMPVGLASLSEMRWQGLRYHHSMTGTIPEYRGRGIATALKLRTLRYARRAGAIQMSTGNNAENAAMLAINRKLGYELVAERIHYVRD